MTDSACQHQPYTVDFTSDAFDIKPSTHDTAARVQPFGGAISHAHYCLSIIKHDAETVLPALGSSGQFPTQLRVSTVLDSGFEPERRVRKKPRLIYQRVETQEHMRIPSGISQFLSTPTFHSNFTLDETARPTTSEGLSTPRRTLIRANTSPTQRRHSPHKRPPASHSSHGVETACGPPPSFSTQRTISQDRLRKVQGFPLLRSIILQDTQEATGAEPSRRSIVEHQESSQSLTDSSSPETADTDSPISPSDASLTSLSLVEDNSGSNPACPIGKMESLGIAPVDDEGKGSSSDERKSEDLFLNIARSDANREMSTVGERRRSRVSLPFFSSNRTTASQKPSPVRSHFDNNDTITQRLNSKHGRTPSNQNNATKTSNTRPTIESFRQRSSTLISEVAELPQPTLVRRNSNATNTGVRPFSRGIQAERAIRPFSDSKTLERNATESTISTTAPSTVWDELDDLKSRIKKLELTGKLPPSSAAAMTSAERPRTATTAATTNMSSSPRYLSATQTQPVVDGVPLTVHPLLHEAMTGAKDKVVPEIYQKLHSTVQDALKLAAMMTPESGNGSMAGITPAVERQIRRRTESMCRNLTELTISLSTEGKTVAPPTFRPQSRDGGPSTLSGLRSSRPSVENSERPSAYARVQSRLENRRVSAQNGQRAVQSSPPPASMVQDLADNSSVVASAISSSYLARTPTTLTTRRTQGYFDNRNRDDDNSPAVRPLSRAMTDLNGHRQSSHDRAAFSREYTSQHPLPSSAHPMINDRARLPSEVSSSIVSRRKYVSATSGMSNSSPLSAREPWGSISVVPNAAERVLDSRQGSTRRTSGLAGRLGSVGSRLRAVRAERSKQQEQENLPGDEELEAT